MEKEEIEKARLILEEESKRVIQEAQNEFNEFLKQFENKYGFTIGVTQPQITFFPLQK